jgi:hypothetical protein
VRGGRLKVIAPTDLARDVRLLAGILTLAVAGTCALWRGPADAMGVLLGSVLTLLNFGGLTWAAERTVGRGGSARALWIGASGLRLALLGVLAGVAVTQTGVGLAGLLLSLPLVPVAVVLAGLRVARTA